MLRKITCLLSSPLQTFADEQEATEILLAAMELPAVCTSRVTRLRRGRTYHQIRRILSFSFPTVNCVASNRQDLSPTALCHRCSWSTFELQSQWKRIDCNRSMPQIQLTVARHFRDGIVNQLPTAGILRRVFHAK
jgi:hypothetical protein